MYTNLHRIGLVAVVSLTLMAGTAFGQQDDMSSESPDIVDTAVQADGFNLLVKALKAADLAEALKGDGPFTVFAPTDKAFKELGSTLKVLLKERNKERLQAVLKYHVVSGTAAMASDVTGMDAAETLEGRSVQFQVNDGTVMAMGKNSATVVKTDIEASNGVIHVIDSVLLPPKEQGSGM